jgi:hypothetical protein
MATLNIGGKRVKVSDDFLRMTPEQQNAAVEEIAGQIAPQSGYDAARADASARSQALQFDPNAAAPAGRPDLMGATAATIGGMIQGVPVLGPMLQNTSDALIGTGAQLTGGNYGETVDGLRARRAELAAANPISDIGGQLAGGLGAYGGLAKVAGGAAALGMEGALGARVANSAVSGAGISAADASIKGGDPIQAALLGGGIGAAAPVIGAGLSAGARAIGSKIAPKINAALNPADEAARRTGQGYIRDAQVNPQSVMSQADEAVARQSGVPLMNVDRGGETTRAIARSVANQSPEARAVITKAADERFETQGLRAVDFIKRMTGGAVDDIGYQRAIQDTARMVNKPRYDAAYSAPQAAAVWTPNVRQLMQSDLFRSAINAAESTGTDFAAISGSKAVRNPFVFRADGTITLKELPGGSRALPSLQFWDQVKRNLDGMIGKAQRAGDNQQASVLTQMKQRLVGELDAAVPQYQAARQGAASFFGAEDALDAGKKFATQPRAVPEAQAAFSKFTDAEKQAFATGYASELIDRIRATRDRVNVINQVFGNQASREMVELIFGAGKARQLEAYIRVEGLADAIRGALGNSTTARQLIELGIGTGVGGAAGFGLSGGNFGAAMQGAAVGAGAKGVQMLGQRVDAKVMQEVARLLTSRDPADLRRAIANATMSPQWMQALEQLQMTLAAPSRALAPAIAVNQS